MRRVRTEVAPGVVGALAATHHASEQEGPARRLDAGRVGHCARDNRRRGRKSCSDGKASGFSDQDPDFILTPDTEQNRFVDTPDLPLVVGVSTRALFDCEDEHHVFLREGEAAYCALQHR